MRNAHVYRGAGIAGTVLFAMPVLDVLLGGGSAGAVHAIVGSFGLACSRFRQRRTREVDN